MIAVEARLKEAITEGDLRNNTDYIEAKEAQSILVAQINALKSHLERSVITDA